MLNNEIKWAGRVYRQTAPDAGGDEGAGGQGDGDGGAGQGGSAGSGGADGDSSASAGGDGDGDGGAGQGEDKGAGGDKEDPPDWRRQVAGEDEAKYQRLQRYNDINAWNESAFQAHDRIRKGEISTGLPEDPTEEQVAEYRLANGIPVDGKYELSLEEGLKIDDLGTEMLEGFLKVSHAGNVPQDVVNAQVSAYLMAQDNLVKKMEAQDGVDEQEYGKLASENWGRDVEVNTNRIENQLNLLPESIRDQVKDARLPNGQKLTNTIEFMNWVVQNDRQINPLDPMPGGESSSLAAADQIIKEGQEMMRDNPDAWYKDKAAQDRFQQALDAKARYAATNE